MVLTVIVILLVILLVLAAVLFLRAAFFPLIAEPVDPPEEIEIDDQLVAEHLSRVIQFETISQSNSNYFTGLIQALERMYPRLHATLQREVVSEFSLLYTWPGRDPAKDALLLMAHMDVVPVEPGSEKDWTYPAFAGQIAEGYVWGRGTLDDKGSLVTLLEAVEWLLKSDFQPEQTVYLAFGQDEEVGGRKGALCIARLLQERDVHLEAVLDEGGVVASGLLQGVERPVAMIGVAEKGMLTLELTAEGSGGHSSMPPAQTPIGILSNAISRLEGQTFPADLSHLRTMFSYLGEEPSIGLRLVMANLWLFGGIVKRQMSAHPQTNAMIRTTIAPTIFNAGLKENVLPRQARAMVNFRMMPGEDTESVRARAERIIGDARVQVDYPLTGAGWNPSPVSDTSSLAYALVDRTVRQIFPGALAAPYLMSGATDSRYYRDLSDNILRFTPNRMSPEDLERVHGVNERIAVQDCGSMVRFYVQLLRNFSDYTRAQTPEE